MAVKKARSLRFVKRVFFYILVLAILACTLVPVFWIVNNSFKTRGEIIAHKPVWISKNPTLANYKKVFFPAPGELSGWDGIRNSIIVASSSTVLALVIGSIAAYSFSRYDFKAKENIAFWALSTRMFPPVATVIPIFRVFSWFRLIDKHLALTIAYLVFNLPFALWMMRGFFEDIPREIDECAMVDGCGRIKAMWRVIVPLVLPGIATTAIFCFLFSWNEFLFALVLTRAKAQTYPVLVTTFLGVKGIEWDFMSAFGSAGTIPIIALALVAQKYFVRGLTYGALK
jgi:ABC-type glycerol-3-phosphate transport system permease component